MPFWSLFKIHSDHLKFDILGLQHLLWKVHELAIDDGQGAHLFLLPLIAFYRSSIFLPPIDCIQLFIRARSPAATYIINATTSISAAFQKACPSIYCLRCMFWKLQKLNWMQYQSFEPSRFKKKNTSVLNFTLSKTS